VLAQNHPDRPLGAVDRSADVLDERLRQLAHRLRERHDPQYADALLVEVDYGVPTIGIENLLDNLYDDEVTLEPSLVAEIVELARLVGAAQAKSERLATRFL
jgi:hypothetical protein